MLQLNDNDFFTGLTQVAAILSTRKDLNEITKTVEFVNEFQKDPIPYGSHVFKRHVVIPNVEDYSEVSTLLQNKKPTIKEDTYEINHRKKIQLTYSKQLMNECFTNENGLNAFISDLLEQIIKAKFLNKYDELINLIFSDTTLQNAEVLTIDIDKTKTVVDRSIVVTRAIESYIESNGYINKDKPTSSNYVLITQYGETFNELLNAINFSPNVNIKKYVLPKGTKDNVAGVLIPIEGVILSDKFETFGSFFDMSNLTTNNFLHFWYALHLDKNYKIIKIEL